MFLRLHQKQPLSCIEVPYFNNLIGLSDPFLKLRHARLSVVSCPWCRVKFNFTVVSLTTVQQKSSFPTAFQAFPTAFLLEGLPAIHPSFIMNFVCFILGHGIPAIHLSFIVNFVCLMLGYAMLILLRITSILPAIHP